MRGREDRSERLFSYVRQEERVPAIWALADKVLAEPIGRGLIGSAALAPHAAFASQGPGVGLGTADAKTQVFAAAMMLFPVIGVLVFAFARKLGFWEGPYEG